MIRQCWCAVGLSQANRTRVFTSRWCMRWPAKRLDVSSLHWAGGPGGVFVVERKTIRIVLASAFFLMQCRKPMHTTVVIFGLSSLAISPRRKLIREPAFRAKLYSPAFHTTSSFTKRATRYSMGGEDFLWRR